MEKETLLMRFKDVGENNSISDHQFIIKNKKFTWAGWWAKTMEQVPLIKMQELKETANKSKLDLLLFNTKKEELFLAKVTDIEFGSTPKEAIPSPNPECTPEYYNDNDLLVWFKIDSIKSCELSKIESYSYQLYDTFPVHKDKAYSAYDNKKVESIEKLSVQERTLILFRNKKSTDESIDAIDEVRRSQKKNFNDVFELTDSNSILLCSDLHFSTDSKKFNFDDCSQKKVSTKIKLAEAIEQLTNRKAFSSLICPGDFTYKADPDEYNKAETFINSISNNHNINFQNMVLVPGNHDMKFSKKISSKTIEYTNEEAKKEYIKFYKQIYGISPNEHLSVGKRFMLKNKLPIEIVGLNSNCLQQEEGHFVGMGYVGNNQLLEVEKEMGWGDDSDKTYAYRILVLHHHLYPIEPVEEPKKDHFYSLCLDTGLITSFIIRNKINLVIHGHKHKHHFIQTGGMTDENPSFFNILSLGSTSFTITEGGENNSIGILDFNEYGFLKIQILEIDNKNNKGNGKVSFERKIPLWT